MLKHLYLQSCMNANGGHVLKHWHFKYWHAGKTKSSIFNQLKYRHPYLIQHGFRAGAQSRKETKVYAKHKLTFQPLTKSPWTAVGQEILYISLAWAENVTGLKCQDTALTSVSSDVRAAQIFKNNTVLLPVIFWISNQISFLVLMLISCYDTTLYSNEISR